VPVAHTCNPHYSVGKDKEDRSLKPAWANSSRDPILKNHHKKGLGVTQGIGVGPEFKPQYTPTKRKTSGVGVHHKWKYPKLETFFSFLRRSCHVAKAGLSPQHPECWDYRCIPPGSARI
jgi:hypothetical protein